MADFPVHDLCYRIHSRTNMYELDIKHWLQNLAELNMQWFSTETTPMLQLVHDAKTLRELADYLDQAQKQLTKPERTEHAQR